RIQVLDEHRAALSAIAVEEQETAVGLVLQCRLHDREDRRNAAAGGERNPELGFGSATRNLGWLAFNVKLSERRHDLYFRTRRQAGLHILGEQAARLHPHTDLERPPAGRGADAVGAANFAAVANHL